MIEPVWQAGFQQRVFRKLVTAFSYPGQIIPIPDHHDDALLAVLATLIDTGSSLADPHDCLEKADWPRLQTERRNPERAAFVVCEGKRPVDFEPQTGTLPSPEQGATLVIRVDSMESGAGPYRLTGPGIRDAAKAAFSGLDVSWLQQRAVWNGAYPLGVDMLLTAGRDVMSLPRTTRIEGVL